MTTEFILPDIGEGTVECELLEWLVAEGDDIVEDQPVAEVMTDKATVQIPAMHAGKVIKLHYQPGDIAKVHAPLFAMAVADIAEKQSEYRHVPAQPALKSEQASTDGEDFLLPDIGEGIVECEIVNWQVCEGDTVAEDQVVVEVMTDKAVVEIPAKHAGVITRLYYQQGDIAAVHKPLFCLRHESIAKQTDESDKRLLMSDDKPASASSPKESLTSREGQFEPPVVIAGKALASPAVRRIARENDINLKSVTGSGKKGRILKCDVMAAVPKTMGSAQSAAQSKPDSPAISTPGNVRKEKVRGVQAAMAKQMLASVQTIPHFSVSDELRMDALIALREELKPAFEKQDVKLSFIPFFIKALSLALNDFPVINSQLSDDGEYLHYLGDHNIGVAVDSKIGLLVPNIKQVQTLSLLEIAGRLQALVEQARNGKLPAEALKGGTISISNIGALGGITATPVINKPEAAIVALGKTQMLPRFDHNGQVVAQHIMHVNWSGDHRIIDGATMVKFNNRWISLLENPASMLMHLR